MGTKATLAAARAKETAIARLLMRCLANRGRHDGEHVDGSGAPLAHEGDPLADIGARDLPVGVESVESGA